MQCTCGNQRKLQCPPVSLLVSCCFESSQPQRITIHQGREQTSIPLLATPPKVIKQQKCSKPIIQVLTQM